MRLDFMTLHKDHTNDRHLLTLQMKQASLDPRVFGIVRSIWTHTFADQQKQSDFPSLYGPFDPTVGYAYLDRAAFRLPDSLKVCVPEV